MTVRKIGRDERQKRKVSCHNCGVILEFYPCDVKHQSGVSMGETEVISYIICPDCATHISTKNSVKHS